MKILYAVQKTGNGHLARAQEIIPILEKYGEVTILTSGSQSQIQLGFPVTFDFKGISLFYGSNGNVSFFKTLFKNNYAKFIYQVIKLNVHKYDLIINDYEPISAWACKCKGGNIVALSHQSSLFFNETPKPKTSFKPAFKPAVKPVVKDSEEENIENGLEKIVVQPIS